MAWSLGWCSYWPYREAKDRAPESLNTHWLDNCQQRIAWWDGACANSHWCCIVYCSVQVGTMMTLVFRDLRCLGIWKDFSFRAFVSCLWSILYIHTLGIVCPPGNKHFLPMLYRKDTHFPTKRGGHVPFRIFLSGFPAGKPIRISKVLVFWLWPHLQVPKTELGRIGVGKLIKGWPFVF